MCNNYKVDNIDGISEKLIKLKINTVISKKMQYTSQKLKKRKKVGVMESFDNFYSGVSK